MIKFVRENAKVEVKVYDMCKYKKEAQVSNTVTYTGVQSFEVIPNSGRARDIESLTDGSCIDPYHEYVEIHFTDGTTSTFRNSFVDLFIW